MKGEELWVVSGAALAVRQPHGVAVAASSHDPSFGGGGGLEGRLHQRKSTKKKVETLQRTAQMLPRFASVTPLMGGGVTGVTGVTGVRLLTWAKSGQLRHCHPLLSNYF